MTEIFGMKVQPLMYTENEVAKLKRMLADYDAKIQRGASAQLEATRDRLAHLIELAEEGT